jgi:hypothetical protein
MLFLRLEQRKEPIWPLTNIALSWPPATMIGDSEADHVANSLARILRIPVAGTGSEEPGFASPDRSQTDAFTQSAHMNATRSRPCG